MARQSPRIRKETKGWIIDSGGREIPVILDDIGLGGAHVVPTDGSLSAQAPEGAFHSLRISLERIGDVTVSARVIRNGGEGWGVRFSSVSPGDLLKVWTYIREFLPESERCPYCNSPLNGTPGECVSCGWNVDFDDRGYLTYWERESLFRQLSGRLRTASVDELRKAFRSLDGGAPSPDELPGIDETEEFLGNCQVMKEVFSLIRKVGPTDLPVLILGESGTGKELAARAIHERSLRGSEPFVAVNCAAIPESLIEAELFGYEKGAFTGAHTARKGKFEYAHKGTFFLDEIGDLPLNLQPKLLRFLETRELEHIGSRKSLQVDVRIVAATNSDLENAVSAGRFRPDLYHRIKVFAIHLPPLRERGEDKTLLAQYFFKKIKKERDWSCQGFTAEALEAIRNHSWPGNVREMINRIRRAVVVQDELIQPEDLELDAMTEQPKRSTLKEANQGVKEKMITSALLEHNFNISQTARSLGISRPYLHLLIKKMGISIDLQKRSVH